MGFKQVKIQALKSSLLTINQLWAKDLFILCMSQEFHSTNTFFKHDLNLK